jgi:hypothetical protein
MQQYLVVYRRSTGKLLELVELGYDTHAALVKRSAVEQARRGDPDVEVVLLSAPSREALVRTHSRYFRDSRGLAADLTTTLEKLSA